MTSVQFRTDRDVPMEQVISLYNDAGWTAYTSSPDVLEKAISNSLFVLTAWDGDLLVGFLRAVGDGLTIVYIQDILVLKSYRRKGIGRELIKMTLEKYDDVRQIVLLTDNTDVTISFYKNTGLKRTDDLKLASFIRLKPSKK